MEALKLIQSTQNGILQIIVPEHFNNTPLEVIVIPLSEKTITVKERLLAIKGYFGSAKFPNTVVNKYDAYNQ
ncbi:MAG: hypothetical protein WDO71_16220 [Bacteroidota bacterium]